MVKGLPKSAWMPIFVTLSARTSAGAVQEQIEGRLDKRRKGVLGPPPGQKCLIFVDDLNMPAKETFGAQVSTFNLHGLSFSANLLILKAAQEV